MVKLDIMSDPICPWCHIGKAQLDRALSERPNHPFEIEWHPFQLNPEMPAEGMDRRAYLEAKFGGKEQAAEVYSRIDAAARAAGLEIDFAAIGRTPNTINAHRLIHWAGIEGRQTAMVSALFAAYFHQGRDIGRTDVLADIADSVEMDASVVMRLLETDADRDTIVERDKAARDMGISAVPTFIVAGQHAVPGAQPPETWLNVIDEISSRGA
ncbi:MAG: DsbA family oxidoreductase [Sediminimonas qiaohouensis]|uniref:DsbA family oxidoreductase n=1 Tax=Sediminimonas qiaohouensis TaxID=552061 RepID=A0A7C9LRB7_9RHOB|nr:DsbA family oxidoreductase [Sediminimonas qiaohouensis]MTJ04116.1 DsbA family oxidoreductase [Sediminimonas qiaohouensis]